MIYAIIGLFVLVIVLFLYVMGRITYVRSAMLELIEESVKQCCLAISDNNSFFKEYVNDRVRGNKTTTSVSQQDVLEYLDKIEKMIIDKNKLTNDFLESIELRQRHTVEYIKSSISNNIRTNEFEGMTASK